MVKTLNSPNPLPCHVAHGAESERRPESLEEGMSQHWSLTEAGERWGAGIVVPFLAMGDNSFNSRIKLV